MKEDLTNEKLGGYCDNNFDLTTMAINIARERIKQGKSAILSEVMDELKKRIFEKKQH